MCAACFTTPSTKETIKILTMGVLFVRKLYSLHLPSNVILLSKNRSLMTTKVPRSVKKTNRINMISLIELHLAKNRTMDPPGKHLFLWWRKSAYN